MRTVAHTDVIPAKAGIQTKLERLLARGESVWTPACAGVTGRGAVA
jgi:hypothetical protein